MQFILNNTLVNVDLAEGSTLLDYIRYKKRLMGTKIGCREGDCGACTILVGSFENDRLVYRSMTSCLMPIGNAHGKHIVTVEGINNEQLSVVQQAMVDTNGTQCGFCTIGFILSFTGFALSKSRSYEDAIASIDGNICRCTGYKSIERAAKIIAEKTQGKPETENIQWLVSNGFLPAYFNDIADRLRKLNDTETTNKTVEAVTTYKIAGGTDLIVQKPLHVKRSGVQLLSRETSLKGIKEENGKCIIGGGVTVTEFFESPLIQNIFPSLHQHIKLVSSTPIRNMATMAGNLVNASPIGDMTVYFLALDASVVLEDDGKERTVKLNAFYKGYKQLDKTASETITRIIFDIPSKENVFNFEKVSKRMHLDIASVNSGCQAKLNGNKIEWIHLSAGGVAPYPKNLSRTCEFLSGKNITTDILQQALQLADDEVAPISDARGSSEYKRLLLRQLIIAHFMKMSLPVESIKSLVSQ